jgi:hypothetical protein
MEYLAQRAEKIWLDEMGISTTQLDQADIWQLKALQKARSLLKKHSESLTDEQHAALMIYCQMMFHSNTRKKLTKNQTYQVFNLEKKLRRSDFSKQRKQKRLKQSFRQAVL